MSDKQLQKIRDSLDEKDIILVLTPSDQLDEINSDIIQHVNSKPDARTVYVTVAKPYNTITNFLQEQGIDTDRMFFIDCITKTTAGSVGRAENCVFLEPQALTDISIALSQAVESMDENQERFLFLDTLSTLMIYNDDKTVGKFAHSLVNKIRKWGIKSIMLTLEEETDEEIISQIRQFCDETVHIDQE